jgi:prepilin signal peptidase PulO-like enzyme (type II secretory pathway)
MTITLLLFGLGLILGSFVNALVWRLHEQLDKDGEPKKLSKAKKERLSILKGRSACTHCGHVLGAKDLVPVLSWLSLRGKCRYCKKSISAQYPIIELITGALFAVSYIFWPTELLGTLEVVAFGTWLITLVGLVALAIYDYKWMLLPNKIIWPLIGINVVSLIAQFALGRPLMDLAYINLSVAITAGIFAAIYYCSKGAWIGGGDVKLGIVAGLLLGTPQLAVLYLLLASILGLLWSLPQFIGKNHKKGSQIAFGPFLIASLFICMLFGQRILDWYASSILGL